MEPQGTATEPVEADIRKSYLIPALEIPGFEALLNRYDHRFVKPDVYKVSLSSIKFNLTHRWVIDDDQFATNQFFHPYQGTVYHGFARSAGLNYWEAFGYAFAGSFLWEIAGETTRPSINDQIATGIGGTFFGEPLFRMSSLLLERGGGHPGFWRESGMAIASPTMAFNRWLFGDRFDDVFPSRDAGHDVRVNFGGTVTAHGEQGTAHLLKRNELVANYSITYGMPGNPDYTYSRPFDYFDFEFTGSTANVQSIMTRGLLAGRAYGDGAYRGVWGLFGSYDYVSPQVFRVSTTAFSLGTTAQIGRPKTAALQVTALAGSGYGAAVTMHGGDERDYHYGLTPQGLLALRLIMANRISIDVAGRDYYVSHIASLQKRGFENVALADAGITLKLAGHHAITVKYGGAFRNAHYPDLGRRVQSRGTVGLYYTYLNNPHFGAVDWR